ncbi:hypothetical protein HDU76_003789 [Blyttiomyces sp. JEL0837]|nr:hypothetical protein HDU76_003789 [Blyttiomyces sp. JEL0837]
MSTATTPQVSQADSGIPLSSSVVNPFIYYGKPVRGQPWKIPAVADLAVLPSRAPGYGCFLSPNTTVGYPLITNYTTVEEACKPGFFCPFFDINNNSTMPVICPADAECGALRLGSKLCLPQGRYEPMACLAVLKVTTVSRELKPLENANSSAAAPRVQLLKRNTDYYYSS